MSVHFTIWNVSLPLIGRAWASRIGSWRRTTSGAGKNRGTVSSSHRPMSIRGLAYTPEAARLGPWRSQVPRGSDSPAWDRLLARDEEPQPGSHLISPRRGYVHHGIYVGDGKVVHYGGLARARLRGRIEEVSITQFAFGRSVWTRNSDLPSFPPQEVIWRARSRVGENRYQVLRNNCEHFCEWCLRGEPRSYQVERLLASRPVLVMSLGVISFLH